MENKEEANNAMYYNKVDHICAKLGADHIFFKLVIIAATKDTPPDKRLNLMQFLIEQAEEFDNAGDLAYSKSYFVAWCFRLLHGSYKVLPEVIELTDNVYLQGMLQAFLLRKWQLASQYTDKFYNHVVANEL